MTISRVSEATHLPDAGGWLLGLGRASLPRILTLEERIGTSRY